MDVRNCTRCGSIYSYDGFNICIQCRKEDEEDFQKVKEYLNENPGANTNEVSKETGVEASKIIKFLRQGRLEISDESNIMLDCERCGTSIKTGRFCQNCALEIERELKKSIGQSGDGRSLGNGAKEKMRITEKYRRR